MQTFVYGQIVIKLHKAVIPMVQSNLQRNAYWAHPANIIIVMLSDESYETPSDEKKFT